MSFVCTVYLKMNGVKVALDDMVDEVGPLEYVKGSHKWTGSRVGGMCIAVWRRKSRFLFDIETWIGAAGQFFPKDANRLNLLKAAAAEEGFEYSDLELSKVKVSAGGVSIHDGRIWHGSGANNRKGSPRRGLGIHFVPAHARFKSINVKGQMWKDCQVANTLELCQNKLPITYAPSSPSQPSC